MTFLRTLPCSHQRNASAVRSAPGGAFVLVALGALFWPVHASAQSCEAPIALIADNTYFASTCDGTHIADTFCGNAINPGPNTVFRFTIGPPLTGQLTLAAQSAEFVPVMYLMDGASPCDSAPCLAVGDTFTPIAFDALAPGEYWLVVAAAPDATPETCGAFALTADASPVDSIFADGFE